MKAVFEYGNPVSSNVLIQMVDDHDLDGLEHEVAWIRKLSGEDFRLLAVKAERWNSDLSPWNAPAVFGNEDFGAGAGDTLKEVLRLADDPMKRYYIGGYSLAGLFALWCACQTDAFCGVAAASPSIWFPGFLDYMTEHEIRTGKVYLSLGDREEKARNPVMATVGDRIREGYRLLKERGIECKLEWNQGNHFREPDVRTAKAFSWLLSGNAPAPEQRNTEGAPC